MLFNFRNQCEELRSTMSKRQQDEIAAERMDQLRVKDEMAEFEREQEQVYTDMWYADMAVSIFLNNS